MQVLNRLFMAALCLCLLVPVSVSASIAYSSLREIVKSADVVAKAKVRRGEKVVLKIDDGSSYHCGYFWEVEILESLKGESEKVRLYSPWVTNPTKRGDVVLLVLREYAPGRDFIKDNYVGDVNELGPHLCRVYAAGLSDEAIYLNFNEVPFYTDAAGGEWLLPQEDGDIEAFQTDGGTFESKWFGDLWMLKWSDVKNIIRGYAEDQNAN